jgi:hypothetical protein
VVLILAIVLYVVHRERLCDLCCAVEDSALWRVHEVLTDAIGSCSGIGLQSSHIKVI